MVPWIHFLSWGLGGGRELPLSPPITFHRQVPFTFFYRARHKATSNAWLRISEPSWPIATRVQAKMNWVHRQLMLVWWGTISKTMSRVNLNQKGNPGLATPENSYCSWSDGTWTEQQAQLRGRIIRPQSQLPKGYRQCAERNQRNVLASPSSLCMVHWLVLPLGNAIRKQWKKAYWHGPCVSEQEHHGMKTQKGKQKMRQADWKH